MSLNIQYSSGDPKVYIVICAKEKATSIANLDTTEVKTMFRSLLGNLHRVWWFNYWNKGFTKDRHIIFYRDFLKDET